MSCSYVQMIEAEHSLVVKMHFMQIKACMYYILTSGIHFDESITGVRSIRKFIINREQQTCFVLLKA